MSSDSGFEEYLASKKIDSTRFRDAEPELWNAWKEEFAQMHPNSFTVTKLNLINPVRRKYQLSHPVEQQKSPEGGPPSGSPKPGRPIIKPKVG